MCGFVGLVLVGVLSDPDECGTLQFAPEWCADPGAVTRSWRQFTIQLLGGLVTGLYAFTATYLILSIMRLCTPVLKTTEEQQCAQDLVQFGEVAYHLSKPEQDVPERQSVFDAILESDRAGHNGSRSGKTVRFEATDIVNTPG